MHAWVRGNWRKFPLSHNSHEKRYFIVSVLTEKERLGKMNGKERKGTEEITYTLENIIQGILDKLEAKEKADNQKAEADGSIDDDTTELLDRQKAFEKKIRGLKKQNISNSLQGIFESMGLPDAKEFLRNGKGFAFTEQEKSLIECLIIERNGKLKRHKGGSHKGQIEQPDFEFLFQITRGIMAMLLKRGYDEDKLYNAMEVYMTDFLKNEASAAVVISKRLQASIENNIVDQHTYLRTFQKFIWMRAMEEELDRVISKWDDIFVEYESLMKEAVYEKIGEMYKSLHESVSDGELSAKTEGQFFDDCVYQYAEEHYKEKVEALETEKKKLLSDKERIKKYHDGRISFYQKQIGKGSTARQSCGEELKQELKEISKIDEQIKQIDIQQSNIFRQCQDSVYNALYGENETIPVPDMQDSRILLRQAKENVSGSTKDKKLKELHELLDETQDKTAELRKFMEIE